MMGAVTGWHEAWASAAAGPDGRERGSSRQPDVGSSATLPPDVLGGITQEELLVAEPETGASTNPDLWLYRQRTTALLRRYMRLAIEVGRLPSLLGREFFRARVTSYRAQTFEDAVIFVYDIERSLETLDRVDKALIALIALRDYSFEETAALLGCTRRTVARFYSAALDRVSETFLKREILAPLPPREPKPAQACQGVALEGLATTDSG